MAATQYCLYNRYNSYATAAPYLASAFMDNGANADLMQIVSASGRLILAVVNYLGNVYFSATGLPDGAGGTANVHTGDRQVIGRFQCRPTDTIATVAQAFTSAFPFNPQNLDIIQVISPGGTIGYYVNSSGVATGS